MTDTVFCSAKVPGICMFEIVVYDLFERVGEDWRGTLQADIPIVCALRNVVLAIIMNGFVVALTLGMSPHANQRFRNT